VIGRSSLLMMWLAAVVQTQSAGPQPVAAPLTAVPAPPAAAAEPVMVTATASKSEVALGEVFTVELKASGPPGTSFTFFGETADDTLELRSAPESPPPAPGVHRYQASVVVLGQTEIPPLPVGYRLADGRGGQTRTKPVPLRVASILPKDPRQQKLADIRGPLAVAIGPAFWLALAVVVALAVAALGWALRRRRRALSPAAARVAEVAPDEEARRALDALAGAELPARGDYRAFYIRLTAVAKRYLERRLGAPVLEMTSAETLSFLRQHPLGDGLLSTVRDLAEAADRIKFARGEGLAAEAERHLAAVRGLVAFVEERLRPAEPLSEEKAA
jgi:hypothetical protein